MSGAKQQGFVFLGSTSNNIVLSINNEERELEIVTFFEFDNKRKMMSVIVKDNDVYKLYCKGADMAILNRLASDRKQPALKNTENSIHEYSKQGLRTLCMAFKVLTESEVQGIRKRLLELSVLIKDREEVLGKLTINHRNLPGIYRE